MLISAWRAYKLRAYKKTQCRVLNHERRGILLGTHHFAKLIVLKKWVARGTIRHLCSCESVMSICKCKNSCNGFGYNMAPRMIRGSYGSQKSVLQVSYSGDIFIAITCIIIYVAVFTQSLTPCSYLQRERQNMQFGGGKSLGIAFIN